MKLMVENHNGEILGEFLHIHHHPHTYGTMDESYTLIHFIKPNRELGRIFEEYDKPIRLIEQ